MGDVPLTRQTDLAQPHVHINDMSAFLYSFYGVQTFNSI